MRNGLFRVLIISMLIIVLLILVIYIYSINSNKQQEYIENKVSTVPQEEKPIENIVENKDIFKNDYLSNVKMTIKDGTLTREGVTLIITDTNDIPHTYEEAFILYVEDNGKWNILEQINYATFNSIAWSIKDGTLEMPTNWSSIYGELKDGRYKLRKRVTTNQYIYVDFEIKS